MIKLMKLFYTLERLGYHKEYRDFNLDINFFIDMWAEGRYDKTN